MKALVYRGPRDVRVEDVPDAKIEWPTDVLVRITSTNICGSDLHMYEGRTDLEPGQLHRLTDFRGLGASGWTDRVLLASNLTLNPNVSNPIQPQDYAVTVEWEDLHRQLVAPSGLSGGGTTTDGTTQTHVGFHPVGNTDGSPSDGWVVGNVSDSTARRVG